MKSEQIKYPEFKNDDLRRFISRACETNEN